MSRKTENIYKSIEAIEDLQFQLGVIIKMAGSGDREGESEGERIHHLSNIEFELQQQVKALRFWIGSLYSYNGKSTSRAKQAASKENGKKGGRPPKEITAARRRIQEIEGQLLPELEREKIRCLDSEEDEKISMQINELKVEVEELSGKISAWSESRA